MARSRLHGMALCALLLSLAFLALSGLPAAAVDDLSVKMWYPDQVKAGDAAGVSLEIRNENYQHPVNVTWTGIHVDWMAPGDFASNGTDFQLRGGQSRIVNITVRVPVDAKVGTHSNYEVIYYTIQNATGGWSNETTWESTITKDFKVAEESTFYEEWFAWFMSNATCLCPVLIVIIVVVAVAVAARRYLRRQRSSRIADTINFRSSSSPPPGYSNRPRPPVPYEQEPPQYPPPPAHSEIPAGSLIYQPPAASAPPTRGPAPPSYMPASAPASFQSSRAPASYEPSPASAPVRPSPAPMDRGVDLMRPADWDSVGKRPAAPSPGPMGMPMVSEEMGPKFCTYCGIIEPGPVCRGCRKRLV